MNKVSTGKIIKNDYAAFLMAAITLCIVAVILTVVLFLLLARRISRIKQILQTGPRATAAVTDIRFVKDRGRVEFKYVYNGQEYHTGTAIMKNKQTKAIVSGSEIEVAIDTDNPKKALVVQLYCSA